MPAALLLLLTTLLAYLLGAVPFGYLVGRLHGIDVRQQGSRNIGATNVGRLLGLRWGVLVFLLDFLKGAVPVLVAQHIPTPDELLPHSLPVAAAIAAFLGHLFPLYLGFAGGKGVATGAGTVLVLMPIPTLGALAAWAVVLFATRFMSLASLTAVVVLSGLRLLLTADPWGREEIVVTVFALVGSGLVAIRHQANIRRLLAGTEHRLGRSAVPPS